MNQEKLKFLGKTTVYGSMENLTSVLDIYDQASNEWNKFHRELRICQLAMDDGEALEELKMKYHPDFWIGKDHYIKVRLKKLLVTN